MRALRMQPSPSASRVALRFALGAAALLGVVAAVSRLLGPSLEPLAVRFVARYGYPGMALGALVSDLTTFPVPPQFYMVTAVSAGAPWPPTLFFIALGSVLGGAGAYRLGSRLAAVPWVRPRVEGSRPWVDRLVARYGAWGMAVAAMSPIPFSVLCYLTGAYRLGPRAAAIVLGLRVPRLAIFYALIALGWRR